jgi:hypothetical protein
VRNEDIDAWMLLAIAYGRRDHGAAALSDVIELADAINHAIPTHAEVRDSINRLLAAGLVEVSSNTFRLTPTGEVLLPSETGHTLLWSKFDRLSGHLQGLSDPTPRIWELDESLMAEAVKSYQAS